MLLGRLGEGAAGAAYLARPLNPGSGMPVPIVIKCLHQKLAVSAEFASRFRHEAAIAVCVESDHVARVYDVGALGDVLYIALEYVPGWTAGRIFTAVLKESRSVPQPIASAIVAQALRGLSALHMAADADGRPLEAIHRDISPKNLMLGDDGIVRIIDLGLGKSKAQSWRTATGLVMGTPGYMAPEQLTGRGVDRRSDLYAMGVVLHELLTGARYIKIDQPLAMMSEQRSKTFEAPSSYVPSLPESIDGVVERALEREPRNRFERASEFEEALVAAAPVASPDDLAIYVRDVLPGAQEARRKEVERLLGLPVLHGPIVAVSAPSRSIPVRAPIPRRVLWLAVGALVVAALLVALAAVMRH